MAAERGRTTFFQGQHSVCRLIPSGQFWTHVYISNAKNGLGRFDIHVLNNNQRRARGLVRSGVGCRSEKGWEGSDGRAVPMYKAHTKPFLKKCWLWLRQGRGRHSHAQSLKISNPEGFHSCDCVKASDLCWGLRLCLSPSWLLEISHLCVLYTRGKEQKKKGTQQHEQCTPSYSQTDMLKSHVTYVSIIWLICTQLLYSEILAMFPLVGHYCPKLTESSVAKWCHKFSDAVTKYFRWGYLQTIEIYFSPFWEFSSLGSRSWLISFLARFSCFLWDNAVYFVLTGWQLIVSLEPLL